MFLTVVITTSFLYIFWTSDSYLAIRQSPVFTDENILWQSSPRQLKQKGASVWLELIKIIWVTSGSSVNRYFWIVKSWADDQETAGGTKRIFLEGGSLRRILSRVNASFHKQWAIWVRYWDPSSPLSPPQWPGPVVFLFSGGHVDAYCRGCLRCHQDRVPVQPITPAASARLANAADVAAFMKPTPRKDFFSW